MVMWGDFAGSCVGLVLIARYLDRLYVLCLLNDYPVRDREFDETVRYIRISVKRVRGAGGP